MKAKKYRVTTNGIAFRAQAYYGLFAGWCDIGSLKETRVEAEQCIDRHIIWNKPFREIWSAPVSKITPKEPSE